jgi:hypothetical protein
VQSTYLYFVYVLDDLPKILGLNINLRVYVPLKNFSLIWRRHHFQNLGLCSVLRAFEHGGIFIVPHLL